LCCRAGATRADWIPYQDVGLGVALSVGELTRPLYQHLFDAGAHRYLLRIETSNPDLYAALHPRDGRHEHAYRVQCLRMLKEIGYELGTGVMIGLPNQTVDHLAADLQFFQDIGADMIGMGPYIPAAGTPVAEEFARVHGPNLDMAQHNAKLFELATRMVALARVFLGNVTVAGTVCLSANLVPPAPLSRSPAAPLSLSLIFMSSPALCCAVRVLNSDDRAAGHQPGRSRDRSVARRQHSDAPADSRLVPRRLSALRQ
jgi:hypothetical protein